MSSPVDGPVQNSPGAQRSSAAVKPNLHWLLKAANPNWSTNEFNSAKKKLRRIGIVSYSDLEEALQGVGVLNNRLREHGLKAFAPSTLERLRSTVSSELERQRQAELLELQRTLREQHGLDRECQPQGYLELQVHTASKKEAIDENLEDITDLDDGMLWYSAAQDRIEKQLADHVSHVSVNSSKFKISPLDLSKTMRVKGAQEAWEDTARTESTALGSSPPESPLASYRSATFYSIGTPPEGPSCALESIC